MPVIYLYLIILGDPRVLFKVVKPRWQDREVLVGRMLDEHRC